MIAALIVAASVTAAPPATRAVLTPTASFRAPGAGLTLFGGAAPMFTLRPSDGLELGVGGAYIPDSDALIGAGGRWRLDRRGALEIAGYTTVILDLPLEGGQVAAFATLGTVGTRTRGDHAWSLAGATTLVRAAGTVDAAMTLTPSWVYRVNAWLSVAGELQLRAVVPRLQAGVTSSAVARFHLGAFTADLGWLIDLGVIGPPLPLVSSPGVPVVHLSADL